jgi:hypothetical protein
LWLDFSHNLNNYVKEKCHWTKSCKKHNTTWKLYQQSQTLVTLVHFFIHHHEWTLSMSFAGVTKNVSKIQKSITYWLSMILIWLFHFLEVDYDSFKQMNPFYYYFNGPYFIFERLIIIALDKWVPFLLFQWIFT